MIIIIIVVESFERPFGLVLTFNRWLDVQLIKDCFLFPSSRMKARFLFKSACFTAKRKVKTDPCSNVKKKKNARKHKKK